MISWFFIGLLKAHPERALTENGLMTRYAVVLFLLGFYLFLFVIILRKQKQSRIRKITALLLSAVLIFESAELIPYLQGEKHVPLEFVGSVETTRKDPKNSLVRWYTSDLFDLPSKEKQIENLEQYLECDLTDIDLNDDQYTYLFVLYYKDVDLVYSKWSEFKYYYSGNKYWIGRVDAKGEADGSTVYIFRFPRKNIITPDEYDC